jgi:ADP-ribose pyrophosphatase
MARQIVHVGRKIQVAVETGLGDDGRAFQRDVVLHPGAVAIVPLLDDGRVVLLRNPRPIVGETLWELPAGTREPGEPPLETARRELEEETGYRASQWRQLCELIPSPGVLSERIVVFVAEDLTPGPASPEPGEAMIPHPLPWEQAVQMALHGTIRDAKTLVALFWLDRLR